MNDEKMLFLLINAVYSHKFQTEDEVKMYFRGRFGKNIYPKDLDLIQTALYVVQQYRNESGFKN